MFTRIATLRPGLGRGRLAAAVVAVILLPAGASAQSVKQTAKEKELEARIAELERVVRQLTAQTAPTPPPQTSSVPPPAAAAPTAAAVAPRPADVPTLQTASITPSAIPGTRFSFGGFIKLDASIARTSDGDIPDGTAGRMFYVPRAIPVGGGRGREHGADTDIGANLSRLWFGTDTELDSGDTIKTYFEYDFLGGGSTAFTGNEVSTNTYALTVRHAYVSWNRWLAGQTWSNFLDTAAVPDTVDFLGPVESVVSVRQAQVRYTRGPWSFSIENPETVYTPFRGNMTQVAGDDGLSPDFTARYVHKRDWGHFSVAALARQLKFQSGRAQDSSTAFGVNLSGKWNLGRNDDLRYTLTGGTGISRYLGYAQNSDAVLDANGQLENIDMIAGFAGWRHVFSPKLRGNLFYSFARYDNDTQLTGPGITRSSQSAHLNLIYSPLPKLDLGAEFIWAQREIESGDRGDLNRLQTHVKYTF